MFPFIWNRFLFFFAVKHLHCFCFFFFFNDPAPTEISPFPLHDALPILTTRFLPHGHKLGFGMVGAQALDTLKAPAVARLAAWDVMRYDQQGCYSPHVFYVERGAPVSARAFADYLAAELANLQRRFARRPLELEAGAAVARWQQSVEWSGDAQQLLGPVDRKSVV